MRLLDTKTANFRWVDEPRHVSYAILSHVWTKDSDGHPEQSYGQLLKVQRGRKKQWKPWGKTSQIPSKVSEKIRQCCALIHEHGFDCVWIDSCCIDKGSSSELSEAINSMFNWYQHAKVCYAYLHDVDNDDDPRAKDSQFRQSRWFTRGWTLQELIAPRVVVFFSKGWRVLGTKAVLATVIEEVTGIDRAILTHEASLDTISIARRISWASRRQTTREEDEAYSLMGILGVNLPTIYGEGRLAFIRLQEEVMKHTSDPSIFVWGPSLRDDVELVDDSASDVARLRDNPERAIWDASNMRNLFALTPRDFASSSNIFMLSRYALTERLGVSCPLADYTMTCHGIRTTLPILTATSHDTGDLIYFAILGCQDEMGRLLALVLRKQERALNEYFVGAFLRRTMTIEDDKDADGGLLLGEKYFRTTHLSPHFISTHQHNIHLQKIYVPHRPLRAIFPGHREIYVALTQCSGHFDILLSGWCKALLEKEAFTISSIAPEGDIDASFMRKRGFVVSKGDWRIKVELDRCSCVGGRSRGWLRIAVSIDSIQTHDTVSGSLDPLYHAQPLQHSRDHPDHVYSWFFTAGLASKQFQKHFSDGTKLAVQLNFSLAPLAESTHLHRTYILSLEIMDSRSLKEASRVTSGYHGSSTSDCWVPSVAVVVDSPPC